MRYLSCLLLVVAAPMVATAAIAATAAAATAPATPATAGTPAKAATAVTAAAAAAATERTQPLAYERLQDAAAMALFAAHGGGLQARPVGDAEPALTLPRGAMALQARVPEGAALARRMVVNVEVRVDARHHRTVPVWFAVQAWRPVWVARSALAPGQLAGEDGFTAQPREVTAMASPPLQANQPLEGLRLRSAMTAGAVLTAAQVEARPAVARHQAVKVRVSAGPVELQLMGKALNDGRIGELVRVLNPSSNESFAARVVADGLVVAGER